MAVGNRTLDGEDLVEVPDGDTAPEEGIDAADDVFGQAGEVGAGAFTDTFAFAPGLADEDCGR